MFNDIFPKDTVFLVPTGTGRNSKGVVEKAVEGKAASLNQYGKAVDEVWAVFDKDDLDVENKNAERFEEAFRIAEANDIKVAYSNECFELWLLLHYMDVDADMPLHRHSNKETGEKGIYELLEREINKGRTPNAKIVYDHKRFTPEIIEAVFNSNNEANAIERSKVLDEKQKDKKPIDANPNTKVYLLVKHLRELLDWYRSAK